MSSADKKRSATASTDTANKRSRKWKQQWSTSYKPKRGPPAILFTCDAINMRKAKFEGLDILQYDWDANVPKPDDKEAEEEVVVIEEKKDEDNKDENKKDENNKDEDKKEEKPAVLSLEDELKELNDGSSKKQGSKKSSNSSPFAVYDFKCKGNVLVFCPGARSLVPPLIKKPRTDDEKKEEDDDGGNKNDEAEEDEEIKQKTRLLIQEQQQRLPVWNPFDMVRRFTKDMMKETDSSTHDDTVTTAATNCEYPGTRHVTRMVPMQTTCYASLYEIEYMVSHLLQQTIGDGKDKPKTTFAIQSKRRLCNHLTRPQLITCVGNVVSKYASHWTVDLTNPDYIISIEVCKSTAGVSVYKNSVALTDTGSDVATPLEFNLVTLRAKLAETENETKKT